MIDMTVKEATAAREKAEADIREILQKLVNDVGAIDVSTRLSVTEIFSFPGKRKAVIDHFSIRLEI